MRPSVLNPLFASTSGIKGIGQKLDKVLAKLLMGGFAQSRLPTMTENELNAFEALIELPDQDLLSWVTGEAAVPPTLSNALLPELLKFRL